MLGITCPKKARTVATALAFCVGVFGYMLPAQANLVWSFNYSDSLGDSASGSLITDDPSGGSYLITSVTGTYDSRDFGAETISGLESPGGWGGNDNLLFSSLPQLDGLGFTFDVSGSDDQVRLFHNSAVGYVDSSYTDGSVTGGTFTATQASGVPEPMSAWLLATGLILLPWLRRRRG